jgi:hypothetical protein
MTEVSVLIQLNGSSEAGVESKCSTIGQQNSFFNLFFKQERKELEVTQLNLVLVFGILVHIKHIFCSCWSLTLDFTFEFM